MDRIPAVHNPHWFVLTTLPDKHCTTYTKITKLPDERLARVENGRVRLWTQKTSAVEWVQENEFLIDGSALVIKSLTNGKIVLGYWLPIVEVWTEDKDTQTWIREAKITFNEGDDVISVQDIIPTGDSFYLALDALYPIQLWYFHEERGIWKRRGIKQCAEGPTIIFRCDSIAVLADGKIATRHPDQRQEVMIWKHLRVTESWCLDSTFQTDDIVSLTTVGNYCIVMHEHGVSVWCEHRWSKWVPVAKLEFKHPKTCISTRFPSDPKQNVLIRDKSPFQGVFVKRNSHFLASLVMQNGSIRAEWLDYTYDVDYAANLSDGSVVVHRDPGNTDFFPVTAVICDATVRRPFVSLFMLTSIRSILRR